MPELLLSNKKKDVNCYLDTHCENGKRTRKLKRLSQSLVVIAENTASLVKRHDNHLFASEILDL